MPLLIALEATSLTSLFAFVFGGSYSCSCPPYIHGIWISIEHIFPLRLRVPLIPCSPFEPVAYLYVFFLMEACRVGPVIPVSWMVEFYAVDH